MSVGMNGRARRLARPFLDWTVQLCSQRKVMCLPAFCSRPAIAYMPV